MNGSSLNPLPKDKILDWSKLEAFADDKVNVNEIRQKFRFGKVENNHGGKGRNCWFPAFSPFPTMLSKGFFFKIVKLFKSLPHIQEFQGS